MNVDVTVHATTDAGVLCSTDGIKENGFWLSRKSCQWSGDVEPNLQVSVVVPDWLAKKHKQLLAIGGSLNKPIAIDQQTNSGALFRNTNKTDDSQPEYTGEIDIEGRTYRLSAWIKQGKSGKFMSLSVKPK